MARALPDGGIQTLVERWTQRASDFAGVGALVDARKLCEQFVADLVRLRETQNDDTVTYDEAAQLGGYAVDSIRRLVRQGKLANVGSDGAPRIRRRDVPMRPGHSCAGAAHESPVFPLAGSSDSGVSSTSLMLEIAGSRLGRGRRRKASGA